MLQYLLLIQLAIIVSIDNLFVGILYGIFDMTIPVSLIIFVSFVSSIITYLFTILKIYKFSSNTKKILTVTLFGIIGYNLMYNTYSLSRLKITSLYSILLIIIFLMQEELRMTQELLDSGLLMNNI